MCPALNIYVKSPSIHRLEKMPNILVRADGGVSVAGCCSVSESQSGRKRALLADVNSGECIFQLRRLLATVGLCGDASEFARSPVDT